MALIYDRPAVNLSRQFSRGIINILLDMTMACIKFDAVSNGGHHQIFN